MARSGWAYMDFASYLNSISGPTGSVQFITGPQMMSGTEFLVYDTASNYVGIGLDDFPNTLPTHPLHIKGDVSVTGSIYASNYYIKNVSNIDSTGSSKFGDSSGDYHVFTGSVSVSEKLAIGTATPSTVLHVVDEHPTITLESNTAHGDGQIKFKSADGTQLANLRCDTTSNTLNHLAISAGTGEDDLVVDQTGYVGIGVTAPTQPLDVAGTATVDGLQIVSSTVMTDIKDEDDMASNSATSLATQQSIKAYVDALVTAQDLDLTTDSGTIAIDLDSETLTIGGTSNEIETSATGNAVTIGLPNNVTLGGNLTLGGNIIKASDGGSTITLDTDDNVTIAGDLVVQGGMIKLADAPAGGTTGFKDGGNHDRITFTNNGNLSFHRVAGGIDVVVLSSGGLDVKNELYVSGSSFIGDGANDLATFTSPISASNGISVTGATHGSRGLYVSNRVGIGKTDPHVVLHVVKTATDASGVYASTPCMILEDATRPGLQLVGNEGNIGIIQFGDRDSSNPGEIYYDHGADQFSIRAGGTVRATLNTAAFDVNVRTNLSGGVSHKRVIKTGNYTVTTSDYYLGVDTSGGAFTLTLPQASACAGGQTWIIKDEQGSCGANPITIARQGSDTIDGATSYLLGSGRAALSIYCDGVSKYFVY